MWLASGSQLEISLGEVATTELPWVICYRDTDANGRTSAPVQVNGTTNDTTVVVALAGPSAGMRAIMSVSILNIDNVAHNPLVNVNVGGTLATEAKASIAVNSSLRYSPRRGWYVLPTPTAAIVAGDITALSASTLLGRGSAAGSGVAESITLGSGLTMTGTVLAASGSGGTVTSVSVVTANGVSGTVATATTTPAITLTLGAITPTTVNGVTLTGSGTLATGTFTLTVAGTASISGTHSGTSSGTNTGDQTDITGNAGTVTVADAAGDTTMFVVLAGAATGSLPMLTDAGLTYNATTNTLTATTFVGALTGNADTVTVADAGGDTTTWVLLGTSQTGSLSPATDGGLTYNAGTNALTATTFIGALTGNATTATALATARNINSVSFDGTAAITVTTVGNLLINGGFDFAQRQVPGTLTTLGTTDVYSADRWKVAWQNASIQYQRTDSVGVSETGITAERYGTFKQITNTGKFIVYQIIEGVNSQPMQGRAVIFQCKMKASASKTIRMAILELGSAGTQNTIPNPINSAFGADTVDPTWGANVTALGAASKSVTTSWTQFTVTGTVTATTKNLLVAVWTDSGFAANDTLSITEAGLFDGLNTQPWIPRLAQHELVLCNRYCYLLGVSASPFINGGLGIKLSATVLRWWINMPVMRTGSPTFTNNVSGWTAPVPPTTTTMSAVEQATATSITLSAGTSSLTLASTGPGLAVLSNTASGGTWSGTAGNILDMRFGPDVIAYFEAEL